jgi:hypothetical protein
MVLVTSALAPLVLCLCVGSGVCADLSRLDSLYFEAEFALIVSELGELPWDGLTADQQMLLLECQARTGNGYTALRKLEEIRIGHRNSAAWDGTAAAVALSIGRFRLADSLADCALIRDPGNLRARLTKAMLLLYSRRSSLARDLILEILKIDKAFTERFLVYEIAHEVLSAAGDWGALSELCGLLARRYAHDGNLPAAGNALRDSAMYAGMTGNVFYVAEASEDLIELPLVDLPTRSWRKCVLLNMEGESYRVLIDTGNEAGWTVCHTDLRKCLVSRRGANIPLSSGAILRNLTGYRIVTDSLNLGSAVIRNAHGISFQKPDGEFYDANLNPFFIRNRVVTIDYVGSRLIFRTKDRFESDIAADSSEVTRVPCYGYRSPLVPVTMNDSLSAIALIETGADDISIHADFTAHLGVSLQVAGSSDSPQSAPLPFSMDVGGAVFERAGAQIRPARFRDEITGLSYDVMIGSGAFDRKYIVSFDPFDRTMILQRSPLRDGRR